MVEPWLRGTLTGIEPVRRAVLHALELADEDAERWCGELSEAQLFARPYGLPSVAFQMRHIVRSLDRLLTYLEAGDLCKLEGRGDAVRVLSEAQLAALGTEMEPGNAAEVWTEFGEGLRHAMARIRMIATESFAGARGVGRQQLPTTVAGLLIHCAEHTQRHVGQMLTTAKVVQALS